MKKIHFSLESFHLWNYFFDSIIIIDWIFYNQWRHTEPSKQSLMFGINRDASSLGFGAVAVVSPSHSQELMSGLLLVQCLQMKGWADVPMLHLLHVIGLSESSLEQSLQMLSLAFAPMIHFVHLNPVDPPVDPIPVLGFNAASSSSPIEF